MSLSEMMRFSFFWGRERYLSEKVSMSDLVCGSSSALVMIFEPTLRTAQLISMRFSMLFSTTTTLSKLNAKFSDSLSSLGS